ncbi:hypothetical protein HPB52_004025 [Rhipicephalus sanguineus]|uniref:Uncharacterized protein n=1 Tax=Rhipicephalus sanguineus TaxID=34632 RepID=A0A9D4Q4S3_RHISA|nr:hypothetical protein HPB52_004025 [Rhipicephalus sanguineus]
MGDTVSAPSLCGPRFTLEPPRLLEFSDAIDGELHCEAHGEPPQLLAWATADYVPVTVVPGVCVLAEEDALVSPPFPAEGYRQDAGAGNWHGGKHRRLGERWGLK